MNNNKFYREEALARLASPERLNEMVHVTSAKSWLVLFAIMTLIGGALAWSIWGALPTKVRGKGILLQSGGINEVSSIAGGKVEKIVFSEGDFVQKNDIVAYIEQPELEMQILNATKKLEELRDKYKSISDYDEKDFALKNELLKKKQKIQEETIERNTERLKFISDQIASQEKLLSDGLITKETLNNTRLLYFQIQQENDKLRNELKAIQVDLFEITKKNEFTLNAVHSNILELEREIDEMNAKHTLNSTIRSPYTGKVVELMVNPGQVLHVGSVIFSVEVANTQEKEELQAIIYIPHSEGKKVEMGMKVKIAPSTVQTEEYGYIEGRVMQVSDYPSSRKGMERILGNSELVNTLLGGEPPIAVVVGLENDKDSFSGYKWTSGSGPKTMIKSGTLCNANIVVELEQPIKMLFPSIKNKLNL